MGLIVGVLAGFSCLVKGISEGAIGWVLTAVLGIAGAFIGTLVGGALWGGENYAAGWIMSIIGAIVLLLLLRLVMGARTSA